MRNWAVPLAVAATIAILVILFAWWGVQRDLDDTQRKVDAILTEQ